VPKSSKGVRQTGPGAYKTRCQPTEVTTRAIARRPRALRAKGRSTERNPLGGGRLGDAPRRRSGPYGAARNVNHRWTSPVARIVPEGAQRLADVRRAVEGLHELQRRIAHRGKPRVRLSNREVRSAIEEGRR
jgi:hypothetical protein